MSFKHVNKKKFTIIHIDKYQLGCRKTTCKYTNNKKLQKHTQKTSLLSLMAGFREIKFIVPQNVELFSSNAICSKHCCCLTVRKIAQQKFIVKHIIWFYHQTFYALGTISEIVQDNFNCKRLEDICSSTL